MSAQENLSREQFRQKYNAPGRYDIPVEHLSTLRTHGLYKNIDELKEDISRNGIRTPIQVVHEDAPDYLPDQPPSAVIEDGVHRWTSARELGMKTVPVNVWSTAQLATQRQRYRERGYKGPNRPWEEPGSNP